MGPGDSRALAGSGMNLEADWCSFGCSRGNLGEVDWADGSFAELAAAAAVVAAITIVPPLQNRQPAQEALSLENEDILALALRA